MAPPHYHKRGASDAMFRFALTADQARSNHLEYFYGKNAAVLEAHHDVGGLGRSWHYGDFHFDVGPHIDGIEQRGGRIVALRAGGEVFHAEHVVWTAPITLANELLGVENVSLDYLSTIFYNLEIDAPAKLDFQWTYYGGDEIFSRISTPTAFAPSMAPAGRSGLCVEVTCREGDERWQAPEQLTAEVIADLVRLPEALPLPVPAAVLAVTGAAGASASAATALAVPAVTTSGWQPPGWAVWSVAGILAFVLAGLAWTIGHGPMGPAYAAGYGLALGTPRIASCTTTGRTSWYRQPSRRQRRRCSATIRCRGC